MPFRTSLNISGLTGTITPPTPVQAVDTSTTSDSGNIGPLWTTLDIGQSTGVAGALNSISMTLTPSSNLVNVTVRLTNLTGGKVFCISSSGGGTTPTPTEDIVNPDAALTCQPPVGSPTAPLVCATVNRPTLPTLTLPGGTVLHFPAIDIPQV